MVGSSKTLDPTFPEIPPVWLFLFRYQFWYLNLLLHSCVAFCDVILRFCASLGASQKRSVMPAQFIYSNLSLFDHFSLTFDVVYDQKFAQGVQFWKLKTIFSMTFVCLTWVASRQMQLCKSNTNAIKVTWKGQQNKIIFVSVPVENSSTCNLMGTNVLLSLNHKTPRQLLPEFDAISSQHTD